MKIENIINKDSLTLITDIVNKHKLKILFVVDYLVLPKPCSFGANLFIKIRVFFRNRH